MSRNQGRGGGHGRMSRLASDEFMPEGSILLGSAPLLLSPLQKASLLVIEANLSCEAIRAACVAAAEAAVPVFMEPVSVPKSIRQDLLHRQHAFFIMHPHLLCAFCPPKQAAIPCP